ncbi:hypothetical protein BOX15_Mlig029928g1 [Macrostomum lignano]|uniref:RING-type domain-containing protein n=1 Tax=Macrostomum lignano TaxID=282301 RepID=A0A267H734_9PLAT|nr:hypothetical protein BOX15_Mlig029928g1 [Macrostomum lignano]
MAMMSQLGLGTSERVRADLSNDDDDADLTCSICDCLFEDPRVTPCGHSFCCACLTDWRQQPGGDACPLCRGRCPAGLELPRNVCLAGLVERRRAAIYASGVAFEGTNTSDVISIDTSSDFTSGVASGITSEVASGVASVAASGVANSSTGSDPGALSTALTSPERSDAARLNAVEAVLADLIAGLSVADGQQDWRRIQLPALLNDLLPPQAGPVPRLQTAPQLETSPTQESSASRQLPPQRPPPPRLSTPPPRPPPPTPITAVATVRSSASSEDYRRASKRRAPPPPSSALQSPQLRHPQQQQAAAADGKLAARLRRLTFSFRRFVFNS